MKFCSLFAAIGMVLACVAEMPAMAQQALDPAEIVKIQIDVNATIQAYAQALHDRDVKRIVEKIFAHPAGTVSPAGIAAQTPEQVEANYTKIFADLAKTQFDHSELNLSVCVMTPTLAAASGTFRRVNKDGSTLQAGDVAYLVTKTADGWRLAMLLGVQPGKKIACN